MLSFFPRDVLDEILNLIESVSEGFSSYFYTHLGFELRSVEPLQILRRDLAEALDRLSEGFGLWPVT